ncbi:MAG: Lrp/AsnC family transcriptional regulator [Chloroflexi bacterium]|nr:Lrp/AsnC family transcriptional regulator [Chloroflexota bacterium]
MDTVDRQLADLLQHSFPLSLAPFAILGQHVGLEEKDVLTRIRRMKDEGIIRQIGPIFDSRRLGYRSTLAAFCVEPDRLDEVAGRVSARSGVSHNYSRAHAYNLWFTLTMPAEQDVEGEIARLADECQVDGYLNLPATRTFKIGVRFDLSGNRPRDRITRQLSSPDDSVALSPFEQDLVRALQGHLPLVERPFWEAADRLGVTEKELLAQVQELGQRGVMRRFGAVLRHRRVGFTANGMACWVVPEDHIVEAGKTAATFPQVSHCYQRPACPPDWPYTLFTMVHGQKKEETEEVVRRIHQAIGPVEHFILYSLKEYKKERVRYFVD